MASWHIFTAHNSTVETDVSHEHLLYHAAVLHDLVYCGSHSKLRLLHLLMLWLRLLLPFHRCHVHRMASSHGSTAHIGLAAQVQARQQQQQQAAV
jgi:hypothetical protein